MYPLLFALPPNPPWPDHSNLVTSTTYDTPHYDIPSSHLPPHSSLSDPNILLSTVSSLPLKLRDKVSLPHKTTGRINLYILKFMFSEIRQEDKVRWSEW
jgi:hypothetical protein